MRIVGGKWAGRQLMSPGGRVRPTAEAIRETMMQLVAEDLKGARMADLFAGTGAIGLEAISRGGMYCDFVENGPQALHSLKANVAALRAREKCRIYDRDAIPFVDRLEEDRYDIVFVDPPYDSRKLDRVIQHWQAVHFSRVLVLEHATGHEGVPHGMSRTFGETTITVLRAKKHKPRPEAP